MKSKVIIMIMLFLVFLTSCGSNNWNCPIREGTGCKAIREIDN